MVIKREKHYHKVITIRENDHRIALKAERASKWLQLNNKMTKEVHKLSTNNQSVNSEHRSIMITKDSH